MKRLLYIIFIFFSLVSYSQSFTLNPLNGPFGANVNDMALHSSGALIVSTNNNGVWRSADGGQTWTKQVLGTDVNFTDLDIDPTGNIYAVTAAKIYKSTDVGVTWSLITSTGITATIKKLRAASASVIYLALQNNNNILKSSNGGTLFSLTSTDITSQITDLDVNPVDISNVFVATSSQGVMVSIDGGFVFKSPAASQSITTAEYVYSIVVNTSGVAFALTNTGPHKYNGADGSSNGLWSSIKGTIAESSFSGQLALDPSQNLTLVNTVAATRKIYTGNTTGTSWSAGTVFPSHMNFISAFEMASTATWYAASSKTGVYSTANSGVSWVFANSGLKSLASQNSSAPTRLFVTAQNRIFMSYNGYGYYFSIDNGLTWNQSSAAPADREINGFVKLANGEVIAYGSGGVIKSSGTIGNSWTSVNTTTNLAQVITYDGTNLFGISGSSLDLLKSVDGGATWTPTAITGTTGGVFAKIQVDAANNIYARTSNNTLYKIATGGSIASSLVNNQQDFSVYATATATSIYALANTNFFHVSLDGGATWTFNKSITSNPATRIWAFKNDVVVTGNSATNTLNFSIDGGSTWNPKTLADSYARGNGDVILATINGVAETAIISPQFGPAMVSSTSIVPPKAPTNLIVAGNDASQVQLVWDDNSDNETQYLVEISQDNNQDFSLYWTFTGGTSPQNRFLGAFSSLTPNTTYYFRVVAKNSWGQSAYTNEVSFATLNDAVCSQGAIPDNRSWTSVTVADPGSTATGPGPFTNPLVWIDYDAGLYWAESHLSGVVQQGTQPLRPFGREDIYFTEYCGQTMAYWISNTTSIDMANGLGTWDPITKTITLKWQNFTGYSFFQGTTTYTLNASDPIPGAPSLSAYIYSNTEAILNWSQVQFETKYKIYRSTTSADPNPVLIATVDYPKTTYIDKGLTSGATYYYKIEALNDWGTSAKSTPEAPVTLAPTIFRPVENDFQLNFENQQGASWADFDGDGDEDMVTPSFVNNQQKSVPPIVYENIGAGQFTRKDIAVLEDEITAVGRSARIADFNNDGKLDFYISYGPANDKLYLNNGGWDFTEIVNNTTNLGGGIEGSALSDYDNDGFIDVFVAYDNGGPNINPAATMATLKSELFSYANGNSFTKVTDAVLDEIKNCRTVSFVDYDNDGDQDIFALEFNYKDIASPPYYPTRVPSKFYRNNGNGTFTKMTVQILLDEILTEARTQSWGDIDNDGDLDLYIGLTAVSSIVTDKLDRLYRNNGDGTFTSIIGVVGDNASATYGSTMGDIDNDGDLDLMVINSGANRIFLNDGTGTFTLSTTQELFVNPNIFEIGGAMVDFDKDGFLDIYPAKGQTSTTDLPNLLYRNVTAPSSSSNWLEVKLVGTVSNRAAIGARITAVTTSPNRSQIRELMSVTGYGSQNSLIQHFGLGTATTVSTVTVRWPSGLIQVLNNVAVNQIITITEDSAGPVVATLNPTNNSKAIPFNTPLEITFDEEPIKITGKKIKLFVASNLVTPVQIFDASVGVVAGNKVTFTPSAALLPNTLYKVEVDDGAFKDVYGNAGIGSTIAWQFTSLDITAPVFGTPAVTFAAIVGKGLASSTFSAEVTDNVSVASATISYRGAGSADTFVDISGTYNVTTGKWDFAVLESFYNTVGLEFSVTAKDADNNTTRAPVTGELQSLFETTSPVLIVPVNPATVSKGFGTRAFMVTATDNLSIKSVVMSYRNTKDGVAYTDLAGVLDGTVANQYNFSISEADFNVHGLEYYFTASDATGNTIRNPLATSTYQMLFETTAPVIILPSPSPLIAKGFASRVFSVVATDNFGIASVVMSYRNTKTGVVYADVSGTLNASIAGQYDFSIPEASFNGDGLEYYFTASDATGNTIRNPLSIATPSTLKMFIDNQAPVVGPFTPTPSVVKGAITVTVKAIDNLAVTSVVMKYRGISSKTFITSSPGIKNVNGDYDFAVGLDWFDNMGIEYYFRAVDASKNIGVSPDTTAATNKYHKTFIKFEGANLPKLDLIKGSTGISGYQIISVPLELSNKNISDNFDELGTADKTAFRFLRYRETPTPVWDEYPGGGLSVLARGEGYFLNSIKAEQITLLDGVAPPIDQGNLFDMALKKGWNQIGNPYTVQIQWSDVIAYNKNPAGVSVKLTKYDNGFNTNDAEGIIEPYKGGFVKADNDVTLKIPFKGFTTGGRTSKVDSDLGQPNWELPFTLTQKDVTYQMGLIGMNREALISSDNYDLPIAPRLGNYIEASFDHPEHFMKYFSQDVVSTQGEYTWEFTVGSNLEGEATMNWNNTSLGENNKEVYLMDMALQSIVNMRERNFYRFDPKESKRFKLFFGENLESKIKPSRIALSRIYPNPTSGLTTISFALPEEKSNAHVRLEVYDIMGKKISTLANGNMLPGFYNAEWDATQANVTDGLYICRLLVSSERGEEVLSEKIIVKK